MKAANYNFTEGSKFYSPNQDQITKNGEQLAVRS
jgi:hypothetical protein